MEGIFSISDGPEKGRPHQPTGELYIVHFSGFPKLRVGDQIGLQSWDGKIVVTGLIIHARSYQGISQNQVHRWILHCHVYKMRAGFPAITTDQLKSLQRKQKPAIPMQLV